MLFLDVNVCLYAFRPDDSPVNQAVADWLSEQLRGAGRVGLSEEVLSAVIRIGTNHRLYTQPATPSDAVAYCESLRRAPAATRVQPGSRHWSIFSGILATDLFRGNDVTDAYLAAMALEQGATMVTRDRGFRRFDGLRVLDPLAS